VARSRLLPRLYTVRSPLAFKYNILSIDLKKVLMDFNLDELMAIQSALINLKMYLSQERKMDPNKLKK
jgi:hypothetical protein